MNPFAFLLPLVSVFVGLAVTDVAKSVHLLLRARRRVRWDALPLGAAFLAVLATFNLWWRLFSALDPEPFLTLGGFLPLAAQLLVLYLLCAASLPDEVPADGLDLRAFYEANAPTFWTLFAVHVVLLIVVRGTSAGAEGPSLGGVVALNLTALAAFAVLATVRRRWVHATLVGGLTALALLDWSGLHLTRLP